MNRKQRRAEQKLGRSTQQASPATQKAFADALAHHQAGRLGDAERLYRHILTLEPRHADSLHLLGMVAYQAGRPDVAAGLIEQAIGVHNKVGFYHCNLGLALAVQGKLDDAVACYRRALALDRNHVEAHNNLGNALKEQGKFDLAAACYRQALALKPDLAEAHNNLGNVLQNQGNLDEAIGCFRRALALKTAYAEAHSNLGNALRQQQQLDAAVASLRQALTLKPSLPEAHCNLGNALKDQGKLDDAAVCYRKAIELRPDYADALNNLALLLRAQGKTAEALDTVRRSLQIGETAHGKRVFVECIKAMHPTDEALRPIMVRALTEPWCRPATLTPTATELIKLAPHARTAIARATDAWPRRLSAPELFPEGDLAALAADEMLCALLASTPICDVAMERFLTSARHALLDAVSDPAAGDTADLQFWSALARQCFINEYVFAATGDELRKADGLKARLSAALEARAEVPPLWVLSAAAYDSLATLPSASRLLEMEWPPEVSAILTQQIREPAEEQKIRNTLPRLTAIDDAVSRLVQEQYEENPYPRWITSDPPQRSNDIVMYLTRKFPHARLKAAPGSAPIDVLVAGCGTGQQPIGMANLIGGARILAVDLSLTSLGYAKRKTLELGLTGIEYAQADLLKLGSLGRTFDAIGCVGVLHHLRDPLAGWRGLLPLLRPGGFMNLGFYSEIARRDVVRVRALIAERGYGNTPDEIRRCRQDLMDEREEFGLAVGAPDFFTTSECRNLLFHAQEHRMTLSGIDAFLRDENLTFLGFEIDAEVLHAYRQRFPDDPAATDLGRWDTFENENPDTFAGMYQFWVQKRA